MIHVDIEFNIPAVSVVGNLAMWGSPLACFPCPRELLTLHSSLPHLINKLRHLPYRNHFSQPRIPVLYQHPLRVELSNS